MDRLTDEDQRMLWPDEIWPQEISALAVLDGGLAGPGRLWGGFWGMLLGLIFLTPLAGPTFGAAAGALIVGTLNNGGNLLAVNAFYLQIIIGALILVAVAFDQWQSRRAASA